MGVWDCFEYSVSVSGIIDARCETVWRLVSDLDHYASVSTNIESSTRIIVADGSQHSNSRRDPIRVGTRFRRTLRVGGNSAVLVSEFTVTEYDLKDANSFPKTVSIFTDSPTERMPRRVSWTVSRAAQDESKCVLLLSATMLPKRLWLWFGGLKLVCVCRFRDISERMLHRELQDFAAAATAMERKESSREESSREQGRD